MTNMHTHLCMYISRSENDYGVKDTSSFQEAGKWIHTYRCLGGEATWKGTSTADAESDNKVRATESSIRGETEELVQTNWADGWTDRQQAQTDEQKKNRQGLEWATTKPGTNQTKAPEAVRSLMVPWCTYLINNGSMGLPLLQGQASISSCMESRQGICNLSSLYSAYETLRHVFPEHINMLMCTNYPIPLWIGPFLLPVTS